MKGTRSAKKGVCVSGSGAALHRTPDLFHFVAHFPRRVVRVSSFVCARPRASFSLIPPLKPPPALYLALPLSPGEFPTSPSPKLPSLFPLFHPFVYTGRRRESFESGTHLLPKFRRLPDSRYSPLIKLCAGVSSETDDHGSDGTGSFNKSTDIGSPFTRDSTIH
jgi:hypothetical protein